MIDIRYFKIVWWIIAISYVCLLALDFLFPLSGKVSTYSDIFFNLVFSKFSNYEFQNISLEYKLSALFFLLLIAFVAIGFWVSIMGIYFFKNWARWLYLLVSIGYFILCLVSGSYYVDYSSVFVVKSVVNMFEGIFLFLMFFVPTIRRKFLKVKKLERTENFGS